MTTKLDKLFSQIVGEAIGEASMCWSERPTGEFDSTRALRICGELTKEFDSVVRERDVAIAELDELLERLEIVNITNKLKQMTIIEAQRNRDQALAMLREARVALNNLDYAACEPSDVEYADAVLTRIDESGVLK